MKHHTSDDLKFYKKWQHCLVFVHFEDGFVLELAAVCAGAVLEGEFRCASDEVFLAGESRAGGADRFIGGGDEFDAAHVIAPLAALPGFLIVHAERQ